MERGLLLSINFFFLNSMKGLLLLYGECFREGPSHSRITDSANSYFLQKEASLSHIAFCDEMKKKGVAMEILIHTYHTKYEGDLRSWYSYPTTYIGKRRYPFKTATDALNSFMKIAKKIDHSYDFVVMTRMDIFLKPLFMKIITPTWNKVYFFSQSSIPSFHCGFLEGTIPAVNSMVQFIPNRYFHLLSRLHVEHDGWKAYDGIEKDFMVDEYYDADTYKDFNPYLKIVGRPEAPVHHDKGKKINRKWFNSTRKIKCKVKHHFK